MLALCTPRVNAKACSDCHAAKTPLGSVNIRQGRAITGFLNGDSQTPLRVEFLGSAPPTPYAQEVVRFSSRDVWLACTLLLPRTQGAIRLSF
jgi:hypothetical protein